MRSFVQTVITLLAAQVASAHTVIDGIPIAANDGVIQISWTDEMITHHGKYPFIAVWYDGQYHPATPALDNGDNPTKITIDLGTIPTSNTRIIII